MTIEEIKKGVNEALGMCSERSPRWRAVVLKLEEVLSQIKSIDTTEQIWSPTNCVWVQEVVDKLNKFQNNGHFHPFTCPQCSETLQATINGWRCPNHPDYHQYWYHAEMLEDPNDNEWLDYWKEINK